MTNGIKASHSSDMAGEFVTGNPWYYTSPPYPSPNPNFFHPFQPPDYSPPPTPLHVFHPFQPPPCQLYTTNTPSTFTHLHVTPELPGYYSYQPECYPQLHQNFSPPTSQSSNSQPTFVPHPQTLATQVFDDIPETLEPVACTTNDFWQKVDDRLKRIMHSLEKREKILTELLVPVKALETSPNLVDESISGEEVEADLPEPLEDAVLETVEGCVNNTLQQQTKESYSNQSKLLPAFLAHQVFDENPKRVIVQLIPQGKNTIIRSPHRYWKALKIRGDRVMVYKLHENEYGKIDSKFHDNFKNMISTTQVFDVSSETECDNVMGYNLREDEHGKIYDYMLSIGFKGNLCVRRSTIEIFVTCGRLDIARRLMMKDCKAIVMWNMVVAGFVKQKECKRALRCNYGMKVNGVLPDRVTWNSIISGHARDGQFETVSKYFHELGRWDNVEANVVSWTALVTGHAQNENYLQALLVEILFGGAEVTNKDVNSQVIVCLDDCVCGENAVSDELIEVPPAFLEQQLRNVVDYMLQANENPNNGMPPETFELWLAYCEAQFQPENIKEFPPYVILDLLSNMVYDGNCEMLAEAKDGSLSGRVWNLRVYYHLSRLHELGDAENENDDIINIWNVRKYSTVVLSIVMNYVQAISEVGIERGRKVAISSLGALFDGCLNLILSKLPVRCNEEKVGMKFLGVEKRYLVVSMSAGQVRVYDPVTMFCSYLLVGHTNLVLRLCTCVSTSGETLIVARNSDNPFRLYETDDISCIRRDEGHVEVIVVATFSKKSRNFLIIGSTDCTLKFWSLDGFMNGASNLKVRAGLCTHDKDIDYIAITPNDSSSGSQNRQHLSHLVLIIVVRRHKRRIRLVEIQAHEPAILEAMYVLNQKLTHVFEEMQRPGIPLYSLKAGIICITQKTHYHVALNEVVFSAIDLRVFPPLSYVYQRRPTANSVVGRICYLHCAATLPGQLPKFDVMIETSSNHDASASVGPVPGLSYLIAGKSMTVSHMSRKFLKLINAIGAMGA